MSNLFSAEDRKFMKRALFLAKKGKGNVSPNPMVGAVFVKNGKIIAEGYHRKFGMPHAEVDALKNLSLREIDNGVLYVTLEPCNHFGKTPPCVDFLLQKKVKKVIVSSLDSNPVVHGKGLEKLKKHGVEVSFGLFEEQEQKLNEVFHHNIEKKMPFVILKSAFTLDGKIATQKKESKWISNEKSRAFVHCLRSEVDAVFTTADTVLADDPHLGVRMLKGRDPMRIILDRTLKTSLRNQVYRDKNVLVITTFDASPEKRKAFQDAGIPLLTYKKIALKTVLNDLYTRGIFSMMIEAGSKLTTSFFTDKLVQKVYFFIAPKIFGSGLNFVNDLNIESIDRCVSFQNTTIQNIDGDILFEGYL